MLILKVNERSYYEENRHFDLHSMTIFRPATWTCTITAKLSPAQGADTAVWLATSEQVAGVTGRFFVKRVEVPSAPCTCDPALAGRVWASSMALLRQQGAVA